MSKPITSDALENVNAALGLAGGGADTTFLSDGDVQQVLQINELARRGRTIADTGGIYRVILDQVHAGAGTLFTAWAPYNPAAAGVLTGYPAGDIGKKFDWWLLASSVYRAAGAGALTSAGLFVNNITQAFGVDDSGTQVSADNSPIVSHFSGVSVVGTSTVGTTTATVNNSSSFQRIGMRLPATGRDASGFAGMNVTSFSTTDAAATFRHVLLMGLFPVGLGQDAVPFGS